MLGAAEVNWGVGTPVFLVGVSAVAIASRGFTAPHRLDERWSRRLDRVRAAIEGENVIQALTELMAVVVKNLPMGALDDATNLPGHLRTGLQAVEVIPELRRLTELGTDHSDTDRLYQHIERSERLRGWAAVVFVLALLPAAADMMLILRDIPNVLLWLTVPVAIVAAGGILLAWVEMTRSANKLTRMCRKYERAE
jgi:hypothetical protein